MYELHTTAERVGTSAMSSGVYDLNDGPACYDGSASGGAPCIVTHSDVCVAEERLKETKPSVGVYCVYSVYM